MSKEVPEHQTTASLGEQLSNAREQADVSLVEMAQKLKLTTVQIQALEQDDYSQLGPVTFVKGYIRAYCREFDLVESQLMTSFSHQKEDDEKRMHSFSRRTEREAKDNRLMLFSYVIIALIIGSSLVLWWQNKGESTKFDGTEQVLVQQGKAAQSPIEQAAMQTNSDFAKQPEGIPQQNNEVPDESALLNKLNTEIKEENNNDTVLPQASSPEPIKVEALADTIEMTFNGDSWVEIFDADGERVAFGVKKEGYVMTVTGKSPFRVVLGKHFIVNVSFNGQAVDLSNFPTNRLAKFSLPMSE